MKTERDFGYEYARDMQGEGWFDGPVNIDDILNSTANMPDGDYCAMRAAGITDPDAREYWKGFNSFFEKD